MGLRAFFCQDSYIYKLWFISVKVMHVFRIHSTLYLLMNFKYTSHMFREELPTWDEYWLYHLDAPGGHLYSKLLAIEKKERKLQPMLVIIWAGPWRQWIHGASVGLRSTTTLSSPCFVGASLSWPFPVGFNRAQKCWLHIWVTSFLLWWCISDGTWICCSCCRITTANNDLLACTKTFWGNKKLFFT